ncbi:MAG TPA: recombination mediator RecR [Candidatus Limnocylindrales bacterium]|nr:recombination mediator RecR [Candidatus Limnocylindrales bacterium]
MRIPKAITQIVESFERLPGVGPKTAQRLAFYLLHVPQGELDRFAASVQNLKKNTTICSVCHSVDETDPCSICSDERRNQSLICVVEQPLDILSLEKSGRYKGVYHVLHGKIDPLNNIGPDEIFIQQLLDRVRNHDLGISETILATNPTMEGEATAMYISKQLKLQNPELKITRIGRGLPTGADIEYADSTTLDQAMTGRSDY